MKANRVILAVTIPMLGAATALADPNYTVIGTAVGAVAGAVVANNVDGVSKIVAIPAGAILGGVIGNQINQRNKHHRNYDYSPKTVVVSQTAERPAVADPHPGVDLIKVSILNSNGIRTDVPIIRAAGKFVGPQGETYDALPSAAELTRRYGM